MDQGRVYCDGLLEDLRQILESYEPVSFGRKIHPVDAFFAYRLLLGRNPDLEAELQYVYSTQTHRDFLTTILHSGEFTKHGGFPPPNCLLMAELEDFRFWFNTSDKEMGVRMASGAYEPRIVSFIKKLVQPGMKCLDIGAQTGFYTCLMASLVDEVGRVYAFEPMPASYALLEKNVRENRYTNRVKTYQNAISNSAGTIEMSMMSDMYIAGQVEGATKVTIEAVRIDDIIQNPIDLIKIDIEGHEPAALEGMKALLAQSHPIILSEANEYWLRCCSNSSADQYVRLLNSLGYDVFRVENLHRPVEADSFKLDVTEIADLIALPHGYTSVPA